MADRDEPPTDEPASATPAGRHGGSTGLSAAELIARSRAAAPGAAARPSRSARHARPDADPGAAEQATVATRPAPPEPPAPAGNGTAPSGTGAALSGIGPAPAGDTDGTAPADADAGSPPAPEPARTRHLGIVKALRPAGRSGTGTPARRLTLVEPVPNPADAAAPPRPADAAAPPRPAGAVPARNGHQPAATAGTSAIDVAQRPVPAAGGVPVSAPAIEIAAPPRAVRAGRNLPAAIGVGVVLGLLIIGSLALYRPSFVFVIGAAIALGMYELVTAIRTVEARPPLVPLLAGVLAMESAAWFRGPDGLVGALLLTVLGVTVWRLADGADGYLRDVASGNLVALYLPFLAGFAVLMTHPDDGAARIVLFILTVVCSDTGGYAVGVLIGKHPMAPTVSPKKSWEGFAGSLLAGAAAGLLMMVFCFHQQWWQGALFGAAVVATATLGDLGESMIKRDLGIKDMGKLLPGHGGIMDRLDSLLPCAPVAYLLLAAFLPG
ncbi:phosphatidate cytidylyltransferase [Jatrophihabitans sp.]|uniref:phosphatidate cytidylyltransferase n=1 Tax=Jatrophihabitans sp. TaxID=1932789 RepID=UPI002D0B2C9D|nr:phosphatidate cytidylyltransferase [Jatrophihabitans sp.]